MITTITNLIDLPKTLMMHFAGIAPEQALATYQHKTGRPGHAYVYKQPGIAGAVLVYVTDAHPPTGKIRTGGGKNG